MLPRDDSAAPIPLLFLIADTGGGHRAAAQAVGEALAYAFPGRFAPVLCDPLGGPRAARLLRWITGRYGALIRRAPWAWGALYHGSDSLRAMRFLQRTLLARADRPVAEAVAAQQPAAIVSFHPLTGQAAIRASALATGALPVLTVVTDLITPHAAWRYATVDQIVAPTAAVCCAVQRDGSGADRCLALGLPVGAAFWNGPLRGKERAALRRSLGLREDRFLIVLTGGGEGAGGLAQRADAIVRRCQQVDLVVICGRNRGLARRLERLAAGLGGRLTVQGYVDNMADWLRCADLVVGKAGPGTVAEATSCGAALLLTSSLPGQEAGNIGFVVEAGAGRYTPAVPQLLQTIDELRQDPAALVAMRDASARLGRPTAALEVAAVVAQLAGASAVRAARPAAHEEPILSAR